jgi:hypothetical protein
MTEEKKKALKELKKDKEKLMEEQHLVIGNIVKKGLQDKEMVA